MKGAFRLTGLTCQVACLMVLPSMALVLDLSAVRLRNLETDKVQVLPAVAEIMEDAVLELLMPISVGLCGIVTNRTGSWMVELGATSGCFVLLVLGIWLPGANFTPHVASHLPWPHDLQCVALGFILLLQCMVLHILYCDRACASRSLCCCKPFFDSWDSGHQFWPWKLWNIRALTFSTNKEFKVLVDTHFTHFFILYIVIKYHKYTTSDVS